MTTPDTSIAQVKVLVKKASSQLDFQHQIIRGDKMITNEKDKSVGCTANNRDGNLQHYSELATENRSPIDFVTDLP